jgi:hypothetical protein
VGRVAAIRSLSREGRHEVEGVQDEERSDLNPNRQ